MRNQKNETQPLQLKVEKLIQKSPPEVFRAIGEGRLFLNCSADEESLQIDFKVGGKYAIQFLSYGVTTHGEFLEIVPTEKIVFTWCQNAKVNEKPDTVVTIELREKNRHTLLTLVHAGFNDEEACENHRGGWTSGLDDLSTEMAHGQLRFMRLFDMPVQKLFDTCRNPAAFFGKLGDLQRGSIDFKVGGAFKLPTKDGEISGRFTEIIPGNKIAFSWNSTAGSTPTHDSQVTLTFGTEEDNQSWLELVHANLATENQVKALRRDWNWLLNRMTS